MIIKNNTDSWWPLNTLTRGYTCRRSNDHAVRSHVLREAPDSASTFSLSRVGVHGFLSLFSENSIAIFLNFVYSVASMLHLSLHNHA